MCVWTGLAWVEWSWVELSLMEGIRIREKRDWTVENWMWWAYFKLTSYSRIFRHLILPNLVGVDVESQSWSQSGWCTMNYRYAGVFIWCQRVERRDLLYCTDFGVNLLGGICCEKGWYNIMNVILYWCDRFMNCVTSSIVIRCDVMLCCVLWCDIRSDGMGIRTERGWVTQKEN